MNKELKLRILSSIILIPIIFYTTLIGSYLFNSLLIICFFISVLEWSQLAKKLLFKIIGFIFLLISFYSIYILRHESSNEHLTIFFILIVCISTDIGGYFFGKVFRGPKLTKVSPNKTYSGVIGSFLFSLISIFIFVGFFDHQIFVEKKATIYFVTFLISLISQLGDLFISYFKRINNIKDSGNLIPGHGGILDRIDGMIFVFPFFSILSYLNFINL